MWYTWYRLGAITMTVCRHEKRQQNNSKILYKQWRQKSFLFCVFENFVVLHALTERYLALEQFAKQ